ncbi:GNAT family N-acetyltransferase [bacterium]|nr:GNAT family N-acetyltransferase [bacterium]
MNREARFYVLKNGVPVFVRPFRPSDIHQIIIGFNKMSSRSRYRRFFQSVRKLPASHLDELLRVDNDNRLALCAGAIMPDGRWEGAGIIRFSRPYPGSKCAEIALTVIDKYQGLGLGTLLFELISEKALECGLTHFTGHVLPDNTSMIKILRRHAVQNTLVEGPVLECEIQLHSGHNYRREVTHQYMDFSEQGPVL